MTRTAKAVTAAAIGRRVMTMVMGVSSGAPAGELTSCVVACLPRPVTRDGDDHDTQGALPCERSARRAAELQPRDPSLATRHVSVLVAMTWRPSASCSFTRQLAGVARARDAQVDGAGPRHTHGARCHADGRSARRAAAGRAGAPAGAAPRAARAGAALARAAATARVCAGRGRERPVRGPARARWRTCRARRPGRPSRWPSTRSIAREASSASGSPFASRRRRRRRPGRRRPCRHAAGTCRR